jgi:hypothetical protein
LPDRGAKNSDATTLKNVSTTKDECEHSWLGSPACGGEQP